MEEQIFKVAAVQAAPVFMDRPATVLKTIDSINEAAAQGCRLIVFPECWIPGYPWYIWLNATALNMRYFKDYYANCLSFDSDDYQTIADAAAKAGIFVSLGASEKSNGSVYIAQFLIDPQGKTLTARRKLKPTHMERTVFGEGNGSDLTIAETALGRIGQLACWEHLQPLSKFAMYSLHEQIHCAAWPSFSCYPEAFSLGPEANTSASQIYALEGGCFVVAACGLVSPDMIEMLVENEIHAQLLKQGGGHARIFAPDGRSLAEPLPENAEGILVADIDVEDIVLAKAFNDPVGHYSRPDVTQLLVNWRSKPPTIDEQATMTSLHKGRAEPEAPEQDDFVQEDAVSPQQAI